MDHSDGLVALQPLSLTSGALGPGINQEGFWEEEASGVMVA